MIVIKILIFGTGKSAEKVLKNIKDDVNIEGFLDNNLKKVGQSFHNVEIYSPKAIDKLDFEYIIIASIKYDVISKQLLELGVNENQIIKYFEFKHSDYVKFRSVLYTDGLIYDELSAKLEKQQMYIENLDYELADKVNKKKIKIPKILSIDETIENIIEKRLSLSRYGDGEFYQIDEKEIKFQKSNKKLAEKLKDVLLVPIEGHVVGLADIYGDLSHLEEKYANFFRDVLIKYRENHYKYIDMKRTYYNAFISRLYSEMSDKSCAENWFKKVKRIWEDREVVIVEGDKTRFGVGNDILDNAKSIKRILAPNESAFDKYDEIVQECNKCDEEVLFLIALGPTATVLAYDLTKYGYQAIDIGHFDIEYEWFLRGIKEDKVAIEGKYTNEVVGGDDVADILDNKYKNEIITMV